jgi:hypothetical protein
MVYTWARTLLSSYLRTTVVIRYVIKKEAIELTTMVSYRTGTQQKTDS